MRYFTVFCVLITLVATCACCAIADEYRMLPVTGWGAGFLKQSEVDKLLGVPGVATSKGDVRDANLNSVLVEVRRRADVCYPSALGEPYMSGLTPSDFNALQAMINAAHDTTGGKKRIEVHCWVVAFRTGTGDVYDQHSNPADPGNYWISRDDTGQEVDALDPGNPKAEQYTVDVCMDLVNNFDIDGIHFDYIRFTGPTEGYNQTSIARYNARYGTTGQPDAGDERFKKWRRDQVTAVVRKVYAEVQKSKPWVKVSGSFIGGAPSPNASTREAFEQCRAYSDYYSDWDSWMQEGIVDFGAPMTYFDLTARLADYTNWLNFQRDRKGNRMMVPDAGTYLNYLGDAINMLTMTRNTSPAGNRSDGFGVYAYQSPYVTTKGSSPVYGPWSTFNAQLISQVTPTWADIPQMPWKTSPTKGHIGGTVTLPPAGGWADGAVVMIAGPENRTMRCDGTGFYAFIDLIPGIYAITASCAQYEDQKTVIVAAGSIADGDIGLSTIDVTPPVIDSVQVSNVTDGGVQLTWTTDEPATSQVEYDFAPYYGQSSDEDVVKLTEHMVVLHGLTPNTTYHFRVKSVNTAGLASCSQEHVFTTQPVTTTIIVDELNPACTLSGGWIKTTSATGWASSYKYIGSVLGSPTASAVWAPSLSRTGPYDVFLYYHAGSNRTTDAHFTINCATGSQSLIVDQTKNGDTWLSVGSNLQFNAGGSGNVTLTNRTEIASHVVVADAVKLVYKGDTTPPAMISVADERYTTSTASLRASWSGSDAQSGVSLYRYAVGTQPGLSDVRQWTDAGTATALAINGLSLAQDHTYYVSARAVNGAGLTSAPMTSAGVTVARIVGSVAEARALADGSAVCFPASSVTATFTNKFYIEDANRTAGIRVQAAAAILVNQKAEVFGKLALLDGCERALTNCIVIPGSMGTTVKPLGSIARSIHGAGLDNVGLLVRLAGVVKSLVSDGFYLDDGSGIKDETGAVGIKVWTGSPNSTTIGARLGVTGVVSCRQASGKVYPVILLRNMNWY